MRALVLVLTAVYGFAACASGPSLPMGVAGISLEDGRIAAGVRTALLNDPELGLRDIAVEAHQALVTLSGEVRTNEEAQRAVTLARGVRGVRDVKSSLRTSTPPTQRVAGTPDPPHHAHNAWRGPRNGPRINLAVDDSSALAEACDDGSRSLSSCSSY